MAMGTAIRMLGMDLKDRMGIAPIALTMVTDTMGHMVVMDPTDPMMVMETTGLILAMDLIGLMAPMDIPRYTRGTETRTAMEKLRSMK